jgi:hypothetical protein
MQSIFETIPMKRLLFSSVLAAIGLLALSGCGSKPKEEAQSAEVPAKPPRPDLVRVPDELTKPVAVTVNQGYVDIVNEIVADQQHTFHAKSDSPLWFRGWAYDDTNKKVPERVWIELTGKTSGSRFFIPGKRAKREDVAKGFKVPWGIMCGYETPVEQDHNIPRGTYEIKLYQVDGQTTELTKYYSTPSMTLVIE